MYICNIYTAFVHMQQDQHRQAVQYSTQLLYEAHMMLYPVYKHVRSSQMSLWRMANVLTQKPAVHLDWCSAYIGNTINALYIVKC